MDHQQEVVILPINLSPSMTLNDLKRRHARGPFFRGISALVPV